jgi:hypothetical protein
VKILLRLQLILGRITHLSFLVSGTNEKFIVFLEIKLYSLCLSIGNIAQLAVDLLISSLPNVKKAGYFNNHSVVQPILGYNPYDEA